MKNQVISLSVKSKGIGDYVVGGEIIRIESVRNSEGDYALKRSLTSRLLKKIELNKTDTYSIKVWCERWYLFEFEHPVVEAKLEVGKNYQIDSVRSDNLVKVEINQI